VSKTLCYNFTSTVPHTIRDWRALREPVYGLKEAWAEDVLVRLIGAIGCDRVRVDFSSPLVVARLVYEIILAADLFQLHIMGIWRSYVPGYSLRFVDVAACPNSPQGSAASLLTFQTLSIVPGKALGGV
jgi:hypothetical protein